MRRGAYIAEVVWHELWELVVYDGQYGGLIELGGEGEHEAGEGRRQEINIMDQRNRG